MRERRTPSSVLSCVDDSNDSIQRVFDSVYIHKEGKYRQITNVFYGSRSIDLNPRFLEQYPVDSIRRTTSFRHKNTSTFLQTYDKSITD